MQSDASLNASHAVDISARLPAQPSARDQAPQYLPDHAVLSDAAVFTENDQTMLPAGAAERISGHVGIAFVR